MDFQARVNDQLESYSLPKTTLGLGDVLARIFEELLTEHGCEGVEIVTAVILDTYDRKVIEIDDPKWPNFIENPVEDFGRRALEQCLGWIAKSLGCV